MFNLNLLYIHNIVLIFETVETCSLPFFMDQSVLIPEEEQVPRFVRCLCIPFILPMTSETCKWTISFPGLLQLHLLLLARPEGRLCFELRLKVV